jgi:hypothetical protein
MHRNVMRKRSLLNAKRSMPCEFCDGLDEYGLLPAIKQIVDKGFFQDGDGKHFKLIHPPKNPVAGFLGVECKMDRPEVER